MPRKMLERSHNTAPCQPVDESCGMRRHAARVATITAFEAGYDRVRRIDGKVDHRPEIHVESHLRHLRGERGRHATRILRAALAERRRRRIGEEPVLGLQASHPSALLVDGDEQGNRGRRLQRPRQTAQLLFGDDVAHPHRRVHIPVEQDDATHMPCGDAAKDGACIRRFGPTEAEHEHLSRHGFDRGVGRGALRRGHGEAQRQQHGECRRQPAQTTSVVPLR